jgi:hypothetical protein
MEDIVKSEQTPVEAQPVGTEMEIKGDKDAISLGKFKDVKSLLDAYNSLQAEFTKRCQRLKELEGATSLDQSANIDSNKAQAGALNNAQSITDEDRNKILQDYLKGVLGAKQTAVVIDGAGVGVRTPVQKPKTIAEAGSLAKEILQNK